jgi:hypothetical protein
VLNKSDSDGDGKGHDDGNNEGKGEGFREGPVATSVAGGGGGGGGSAVGGGGVDSTVAVHNSVQMGDDVNNALLNSPNLMVRNVSSYHTTLYLNSILFATFHISSTDNLYSN